VPEENMHHKEGAHPSIEQKHSILAPRQTATAACCGVYSTKWGKCLVIIFEGMT
jgi:hypothetical protein